MIHAATFSIISVIVVAVSLIYAFLPAGSVAGVASPTHAFASSNTHIAVSASTSTSVAGSAAAGGAVQAPGGPLALNPLPLGQIKLMNYYPANASWTNMWTDWNPAKLGQDFATMASMSANAVRLGVFPSVMGFPVPKPLQMQHLEEAVSLAEEHGLRVQLTFFDWFSDFTDIPGSTTWLIDVASAFTSDAEIAFMELANEVDMFNGAQASWVDAELPVLKDAAGTVPVTVSVTTDPDLVELKQLMKEVQADPPSFYDIHVYGDPGTCAAEITAAQALVAPAGLYVGETGTPSEWPHQSSQTSLALQDWYYRAVEWADLSRGLPPAAPWTFIDFTGSGVPSASHLNTAGYHYGLYTTADEPKPAAQAIKTIFSTGNVDTSFNGTFTGGSDGMPFDWQTYYGSYGNLSWDPSLGYAEPGSVRIGQTRPAVGGTPSFWAEPVVGVLHPGETFRATAYGLGDNATGQSYIAIAWFDAYQDYLGETVSAPLPQGTYPWQQLSVTSSAPRGAAFPKIYVLSAANNGTVWFDDVTWSPLN